MKKILLVLCFFVWVHSQADDIIFDETVTQNPTPDSSD
jgi:hypothetical protein